MPFGGDTVTLVNTQESGSSDALGNLPITETLVNAPGCRHRPLTFAETAELQFDISTEFWRTTIPIGEYETSLLNKVLAIKGNDVVRINGQDYQIIGGIRPHDDMEGLPFKATIISKKHIG